MIDPNKSRSVAEWFNIYETLNPILSGLKLLYHEWKNVFSQPFQVFPT